MSISLSLSPPLPLPSPSLASLCISLAVYLQFVYFPMFGSIILHPHTRNVADRNFQRTTIAINQSIDRSIMPSIATLDIPTSQIQGPKPRNQAQRTKKENPVDECSSRTFRVEIKAPPSPSSPPRPPCPQGWVHVHVQGQAWVSRGLSLRQG